MKNAAIVFTFVFLIMVLTIAIYYTQSDNASMILFYGGILISIIVMIFAIVQWRKKQ